MSHLALSLLGPYRIVRDAQLVVVDTRKAVALLAYLAVTRQRQRRDILATLLWPEYSQANARAALRRTLSSLSKALHGEHIEIERETVGLKEDGLWVDVWVFRSCIEECLRHGHAASEVCARCVEPLTTAAELYRGNLLAGFALRDSPDFDDWQIYEAEKLQRELGGVFEKLARCYAALAEPDKALEYARRWLALDRLHEAAHRYLMMLYAWSGRKAAAIQQYRDCVQVLQQELGVVPLEVTTQLYNSIKENRVPPPPAGLAESAAGGPPQSRLTSHLGAGPTATPPTPATSPASSQLISAPPADMPMVGRAREWLALRKAYESIKGKGRVLVILGEAGIGKTRLAMEFLTYAAEHRAAIVVARSYEGEANIAYGPIVEALRAALRLPGSEQHLAELPSPWLAELVRLLPELAAKHPAVPAAPPLSSPGAQGRFYEGVRQALASLLRGPAPGVLLFDNVQWADGASVDLLTYIARRLDDLPLCLLLAWRSEDVRSGSSMNGLVSEAERKSEATVLSLDRLSHSEVGELVRSAGMSENWHALADRLYNETEGSPFFLVEYLGALSRNANESGTGEWLLPGGVRDLLSSRLRSVDEAGLQLLNTAAVIGRSFDFDTLQQASGRSEEESVEGLEALIAGGLVVERGDTSPHARAGLLTYDFSHDKLRNLVYEETSLARRRLLHRRIAEALASRARSSKDAGALAGQIAHHYRMAGNEGTAAEYYRQAGEYARSLYANAEALAHLQTALALGHPDLAGLHEATGDLQTLLGEYSAAVSSYETAAALADSGSIGSLEHKLGAVYGRRGEWEHAESHLEAALAAYEDQEGERSRAPVEDGRKARVYADWSLVAYHHGDNLKAQELATQAFELAEAAGDTRAQAQAHNMLGILASSRGDLREAESNLGRSLDLARELDDRAAQAAALNNLALAYGSAGETARALELARSALSLSVAQGDRPREAAIHSNLADLLHASRRSDEAMLHLKQAVAIYAEIGVESGDVQPAIWRLTEW